MLTPSFLLSILKATFFTSASNSFIESTMNVSWLFFRHDNSLIFLLSIGRICGYRFRAEDADLESCPAEIIAAVGQFNSSLETLPLANIQERLAVYAVRRHSSKLILIRIPSFCSHS
jgi:hypothetical protein